MSGARSGWWLALLIAGGAGALPAQAVGFTLPAGPYAVGFEARDLVDRTRTYRATVTVSGAPETRERGRPVQTSIWYPAAPTGRAPMRYADYFALAARQEGALDGAALARAIAAYRRLWLAEGITPGRMDSVLQAPVAARRNVAPARGRFPVVVYNAGGGQPSWDNSVLCEFLASHGYVVIASPSTWNWERTRALADDIASAEAAARDMEFQLGVARTLPYADPGPVAVMGYSWGGLAGPMVAERNGDVAAVVNLDGSIRYYPELFATASHHDPAAMRAAFLQLSQGLERMELEAKAAGQEPDTAMVRLLTRPFAFFEGIRYADAWHVTMRRFGHGNFSSNFVMLWGERHPGEPTEAEDVAGYGVLGRYVLAFLNANLRHDAAARAWLARSPADNGVPPGVVEVAFRPARAEPPPTIDGFARYAGAHGFEALRSLADSIHQADSTYGLSEDDAGLWAQLLGDEGQQARALWVRRWTVERFPDSRGAQGSLCQAIDGPAERHACWAGMLARWPDSDWAKQELAKETAP